MSDLLRQAGSAWFTQGIASTVPGGSTNQIQFNNAGVFDGSSNLTYDGTTFIATVGEINFSTGLGPIYLTCLGTVYIGDVRPDGNGTLLTVSDADERATFNKKAVITDTGSFYIYDSGTSTYWKWESINGVWTPTDTMSASLP